MADSGRLERQTGYRLQMIWADFDAETGGLESHILTSEPGCRQPNTFGHRRNFRRFCSVFADIEWGGSLGQLVVHEDFVGGGAHVELGSIRCSATDELPQAGLIV